MEIPVSSSSSVVAVCELVEGGAQAIFGPTDHILGLHIHSICDALDIPHLETRPDLDLFTLDSENDSHVPDNGGAHIRSAPGDISTLLLSRAGDAADNANGNFNQQRRRRRRFSINLHPAQHLINTALLDVVNYLNWTRVAVVFEGNDGMN